MKKNIFSIFCFLFSVLGISQNPNFNWVKTFGTSVTNNSGMSVAIDQQGFVYTTGSFDGTVDFDPGVGTFTLTSLGNGDIFITKMDSLGNFIWAKKIGAGYRDVGHSIIIDNLGNLIIAGEFERTVDFNPGTGTYNMTSVTTTAQDAFILKLDANGSFIWANKYGGNLNDIAYDVSEDSFGNLIIGGMSRLSAVNTSFVMKLNNAGSILWTNFFLSNLDGGEMVSIDTDINGNIYTSGSFSGITDFDPGAGTHTIAAVSSTASAQDGYICKLDANGQFKWVTPIAGPTAAHANSLQLDKKGKLYVIGSFDGTTVFGSGVGSLTLTTVGNSDAFITRMDTLGNFVWLKQYGSTSAENGIALDLDSVGNIYSTGKFNNTIDFDLGIGTSILNSTQGQNFFLKIDSLGNFIWVNQIGVGTLNVNFILQDNLGNIYSTGSLFGVTDFDPNSGTYNMDPANGNIFIHRMGNCMTPITPVNITSLANSIVCSNATTTLSASGIGTISWYSSATATISLSNSSTFTIPSVTVNPYYIESRICNVSSSRTPITFSVNPTPTITITDTTVCYGSSFSINTIGANTYTWSSGATTPSITVISYVSNSYNVIAMSTASCSTSKTFSVTVDVYCRDIWPGDVNNDGASNNLDILELGLHYNQTGVSRASVSNNWQSYYCGFWAGNITGGEPLSHADCNGDGVINNGDTLAIYNNYGLTHTFKPAQSSTVNPQLSIVADQLSVAKGTWGTASIYLGDALTTIYSINGLAFTVDFDNTLIETNSIYIEYQNSFIDVGQNLHFRKLDFTNSKLFTATTHTVNSNANGFGKIATLYYQIKSSLTTDQVLNLGISQANQSGAAGAISPLTSGTATLLAIGASVGLQEFSGGLISISPNPTNGSLTIISKTELQKIEVVSITGQILVSEIPTNVSHTLHLENSANGIYFVNVYQKDRIVKREKVVLNK